MGDWRTVRIEGTCNQDEVGRLREALDPGPDYKNFHCLSVTSGIMGLGDWAAPTIRADGNLAERNYTVESVAKTLEKLATVAPSLSVKVHCGGDYEDKTVIATITLKDGKATIGAPEIAELSEPTESEMKERFLSALLKARRLG